MNQEHSCNKKIFFDHIPKSGGSTLHKIFKNLLGEDNVSEQIKSTRAAKALNDYKDYRAICGHFWFAAGDNLPQNRYCLTLLRHPIDRALSQYFFSKFDMPITGNHAADLPKDFSIQDYFFNENPLVKDQISDTQTRHFLQLNNNDSKITKADQLESAKKALDFYDLIGVYYQFNEFIDILCYECGWPPVKEIPRENVTSKRPKLSEIDHKIIRRLEELNQLDLALYDYATQLFNKKKHQVLHECIERQHREIYNSPSPPPSQDTPLPLIPLPEEGKKTVAADEAPLPTDFGNRQLEIIGIEIKGTISLGNTLLSGEEIAIRLVFRAHIDVENLTVGIHIHNRFGRLAFGANSECLGHTLRVRTGGIYFVDYRFRNDLGIGAYTVGAALHIGSSHLSGCFHWRDEVTRFEVVGNIGYHFEGVAKLYPQLRCGVLGGNPADIQILPAAYDWPHLQQIAIHTPQLTEFRAQICLLQALERVLSNEVVATEAEITNTSDQYWGSTGQRPVHLSYHWRTPGGEWLEFDGLRTPLPHDIAPSETFRHYLTIKSPSQSGDAVLQLTLVQEGVAWFDEQGCPPLEIRVRIGE